MAAARVPTTAMATGRPRGRVRMSRSMWRRSVATPNRPRPARAKKMRARARPWLVLPPANEATALTMAAKLAGVAQGVPVWLDWKRKIGHPRQEGQAADHHGHQRGPGSPPPGRPAPPRLSRPATAGSVPIR